MKIGLLSNLRAGQNDVRIASLLKTLDALPEIEHVETTSAEVVPEALWDFASKGVDVIAVNGGDGTLQAVLTEILEHDAFEGRIPFVAPLRGGRTNMTALDIGTRRDSARALRELARVAEQATIADRVVERSVLRVQYGIQREVKYGMFFGAGTIHRATQLVHRVFPKGRAQGVLGGTMVTAGLLGRLATGRDPGKILAADKARVVVDHELLEPDQYTLLMATSLDRLFAGMRPFWGEGDGRIRFTSIAKGARQVARAVPGILAGRPGRAATEANGFTSRSADSVELAMDCGFNVDGELVDRVPGGRVWVTASERVPFVRV